MIILIHMSLKNPNGLDLQIKHGYDNGVAPKKA